MWRKLDILACISIVGKILSLYPPSKFLERNNCRHLKDDEEILNKHIEGFR